MHAVWFDDIRTWAWLLSEKTVWTQPLFLTYEFLISQVTWPSPLRPNAGKFFATFNLFIFTCCFWILGCLFPVWLMLCSAVHHRSLSLNWMEKKNKKNLLEKLPYTQDKLHLCSHKRHLTAVQRSWPVQLFRVHTGPQTQPAWAQPAENHENTSYVRVDH